MNGVPTNKWILQGINANVPFPSMHVLFAIKHCNVGKIDSHLWLFKGFANFFNPEIIQWLDIGTVPQKSSISRLVHYMRNDPLIGACTGEVEVLFTREMMPTVLATALTAA